MDLSELLNSPLVSEDDYSPPCKRAKQTPKMNPLRMLAKLSQEQLEVSVSCTPTTPTTSARAQVPSTRQQHSCQTRTSIESFQTGAQPPSDQYNECVNSPSPIVPLEQLVNQIPNTAIVRKHEAAESLKGISWLLLPASTSQQISRPLAQKVKRCEDVEIPKRTLPKLDRAAQAQYLEREPQACIPSQTTLSTNLKRTFDRHDLAQLLLPNDSLSSSLVSQSREKRKVMSKRQEDYYYCDHDDDDDDMIGDSASTMSSSPEPSNPPLTITFYPTVANTTSTSSPPSSNSGPIKRFQCAFEGCGKTFAQSNHLKSHLRLHTGDKLFRCDIPDCSRVFTQIGHLASHKRVHTGERPFACDFPGCSRAFSQSTNLAVHKRIHDARLSKPHQCQIEGCDKMYSARSRLRLHIAKVHNIDPTTLNLKSWKRPDSELLRMPLPTRKQSTMDK